LLAFALTHRRGPPDPHHLGSFDLALNFPQLRLSSDASLLQYQASSLNAHPGVAKAFLIQVFFGCRDVTLAFVFPSHSLLLFAFLLLFGTAGQISAVHIFCVTMLLRASEVL
jgi:hypothetical protein